MNRIGIMQGRLSTPFDGRIQFFPVHTWREELALAQQAGFDCIEWVFEQETLQKNPLMNDKGIAEIKELSEKHHIRISSICANYFMKDLLFTPDGKTSAAAYERLGRLAGAAAEIGADYIVLPLLETAKIQVSEGIVHALRKAADLVRRHDIDLHLETDLEPDALAWLMRSVERKNVLALFDMGNSASLGFDPRTEIKTLAPYLGSVHVKDRILGGGSFPLGQGSVNFKEVFSTLKEVGYPGQFIFEIARVKDMIELQYQKQNLAFVKSFLSTSTSGRPR
ncbi:MAG: sugar phosphate isomerase/epimerase family protein [Nanoarchaeota archaeon]